MALKLCDFLFSPFCWILEIFSKIVRRERGGLLQREVTKIRGIKLFFLLKMAETCGRMYFSVRKIIFDHKKVILASLNRNSEVNVGTQRIIPALKDQVYDVISVKIEQQIF